MDFLLCLILSVLYDIPSLVAIHRQKRNKEAIIAVNWLLGWTIVGWVCALAWALGDDQLPGN